MIPAIRKRYNEEFTEEKYHQYLKGLDDLYPGNLQFRIAETPIFVPKTFTAKMLEACEHIIDILTTPQYKKASERAIPPHLKVPNEKDHPHFIAFDFGICNNNQEELEPQLIELQGFPSLFAWQVLQPATHKKNMWWPGNFDCYLNNFNADTYTDLFRRIVVADSAPENVILLETDPEQQKTRVDFYATETLLGIKTVNLVDLIQEGNLLYYINEGRKIQIHRIYNRVIFDELLQKPAAVQEKGKIFQQQLDVEWVTHPNWFYRISKFSLPFIHHPNVPETFFLNEVQQLPSDLENYVVKPLFSFAGQGVIIDVTREDLEKIQEPENWIIQKKVSYAAAIETPDEPAKGEIRVFYFWPEGATRPIAVNNLARLSKGKMVGVRYNQDKTWVGGTFSLFEK
jgi:hypothetical protein